MLGLLWIFSTVVLSSLSFSKEPPRNPFLADSPWPMSHRNPYNQASSPLEGPTSAEGLSLEYLDGDPVSITLAYSEKANDGSYSVWGTTLKKVFKVRANANGNWSYVDSYPLQKMKKNQISGAYTVLDKDGFFYVPRGLKVLAFHDSGDPASDISLVRSFQIPSHLLNTKEDAIVGINLSYDGYIVFVTKSSLVGVLSRDFSEFHSLRLSKKETVSNSLALDEDGGLYIVTSEKMYRAQWSNPQLALAWSAKYKSDYPAAPGRLGEGSGTTPTVMGTDKDRLITIADGQRLMNLVYFWADQIPEDWHGIEGEDRRIAAQTPITFGDHQAKSSITEQSLLVRDYGAVVVNNAYGKIKFPKLFKTWYDRLTIFFSNQEGIAPYGVERFDWDPVTRTLTSTWANRKISCPNGIPSMSEATGLVYCIGQRNEVWTLEGIRWDNGQSEFHKLLGKKSKYNSFYSATEVGYDRGISSGAVWGLIHLGY